jgi:hypothetical protein
VLPVPSPYRFLMPTYPHGRALLSGREQVKPGAGAAVRQADKKPDPAPKFARSLTRCTEISERSVMDVAHEEMVEADLTPAGAKRSAWRGSEYHHEQTERHRAVERHQDRCYYEPQLRGGG